MSGERGDLWLYLRTLDLARRLRADLDGLADSRPELAAAVPGIAVYLADLLEDHPEAGAILRGASLAVETTHILALAVGGVGALAIAGAIMLTGGG